MVAGDLDGFFGLAVDNLIQFLLIMSLCTTVLGFPAEFLVSRVLPGAALSIVIGNLYYARLAKQLARETGRQDVTALPYGINTVSLFAFIFLVMLPARIAGTNQGLDTTAAATFAWQIGLAACFLSGVIELVGALIADWVLRVTPRAALLSTLSGIAISFIAIDFAVRTFAMPLVAFLPLTILLVTYFSGLKLPGRIPGGALALLCGSAAAWALALSGVPGAPVSVAALPEAFSTLGFHPPLLLLTDLWAGLTHPLTRDFLVPVILPMGLFNVLGSLENLESASAAGDTYPTRPCMTANGLGSLAASAFGSCFPTTIYIGHPGWKALGARAAYSSINGIFFALVTTFGVAHAINAFIPVEAGMAIVLWIGIIITAQAFSATPTRHAPAVALGLFPAIAAWGTLVLTQALNAASLSQGDPALAARVLENPGAFLATGLNLGGMTALSQGFMLTSLLWSGACACLIDRQFIRAAVFMLIAALLAFFGFIHAGSLTPAGGHYALAPGAGSTWATAYVGCALFLLLIAQWAKRSGQETRGSDVDFSHHG